MVSPAGYAASSSLTCTSRAVDVAVSPPGCGSADPPVDVEGRMVSSVAGPYHWNAVPNAGLEDSGAAAAAGVLAASYSASIDTLLSLSGSSGGSSSGGSGSGSWVPFCVGSPPPEVGWSSTGVTAGPRLGTPSTLTDVDEDTEQGSQLLLTCPQGCGDDDGAGGGGNTTNGDGNSSGRVVVVVGSYGGVPAFSDSTPICAAAAYAGALLLQSSADNVTDSNNNSSSSAWGGGVLLLTLLRWGPQQLSGAPTNDTNNSSWSPTSPSSTYAGVRAFTVVAYSPALALTEVATVAGAPAAPLDPSCGGIDAAPPTAARFSGPFGIAAPPSSPLDASTHFLVVADTHNHVIRGITAPCGRPCENGGACVGVDTCACAAGWAGFDCTIPLCGGGGGGIINDNASMTLSSCSGGGGGGGGGCGPRQLCTGPNSCTCIPGYSGFPSCSTPQCVQPCANGGVCVAPDTCGCAPGWFGTNCTAPVCSQTCGNGGQCVGPDSCACPAWWGGEDCRTPICPQGCGDADNGGVCVAPNTCRCPPQWSGADCSLPVCHQGVFRAGVVTLNVSSSGGGGGGSQSANATSAFGNATSSASNSSSGGGVGEGNNSGGGTLYSTAAWAQFVPCDYAAWCAATNEFACHQVQLTVTPLAVPSDVSLTEVPLAGTPPMNGSSGSGGSSSSSSSSSSSMRGGGSGGAGDAPCLAIELGLASPALPFRLDPGLGSAAPTPYMRLSPTVGYATGLGAYA